MLIDLVFLHRKYNLDIKGILHVGAHTCEELSIYKKVGLSEDKIVWIEGNCDIVHKVKQISPNCRIFNALISDKDGETRDFIITNNGQSSSILELKEHLKEHPHVFEVDRKILETITIDTFIKKYEIEKTLNFVNMDIQGAELLALKGMIEYLQYVDYLYLEVNEKELYANCGLISDIDEFLKSYNFIRKETNMTKYGWGDALYIKEKSK